MAFAEQIREYFGMQLGPFRLERQRTITRYEGEPADPLDFWNPAQPFRQERQPQPEADFTFDEPLPTGGPH